MPSRRRTPPAPSRSLRDRRRRAAPRCSSARTASAERPRRLAGAADGSRRVGARRRARAPTRCARPSSSCSSGSRWSPDRGPRGGAGRRAARASPRSPPTATSSARAGPAAAAPPARACSSCRPPSTRPATTLDAATAARRAAPGSRWARPASGPREVGAEVEAALERLHESDARMAAVAEQLGRPRRRDARRRPPRPTAPSGPSPRRASRSSATATELDGPASSGWPRPRPRRPRRARTLHRRARPARAGREPRPAPPRPSCG